MTAQKISVTKTNETETNDIWLEARIQGKVVARLRYEKRERTTIIKFVTVRPDFKGRGIARSLVDSFKDDSDIIVAKGVRYNARGFWAKVGFTRAEKNYRWPALSGDRSSETDCR
jgi:N-acetylglutamate synthase-like GNAT family acetyltransferase